MSRRALAIAIGAAALVLATVAFRVAPSGHAGLALVVLALALILGEALTPALGLLGLGGVALLAIASPMLPDGEVERLAVTAAEVAGLVGAGAVLLALGASAVLVIAPLATEIRRRRAARRPSGRHAACSRTGRIPDSGGPQ